MLKDNVLLKEIPRAWYFTSNFVCQKLVPRENLKIFQCFAGCCCCSSFFFRFFVFFRSVLFSFLCHVESRLSPVMMFLLFFFVFFKFFLLGFLLYSWCSFTCLGFANVVFKGIFFFCVGVTNVVFKGIFFASGLPLWGWKVRRHYPKRDRFTENLSIYLSSPAPNSPRQNPSNFGATTSHWLLYILLFFFFLILTGWMRGALCVATCLYTLYQAADDSISGWEFFGNS